MASHREGEGEKGMLPGGHLGKYRKGPLHLLVPRGDFHYKKRGKLVA